MAIPAVQQRVYGWTVHDVPMPETNKIANFAISTIVIASMGAYTYKKYNMLVSSPQNKYSELHLKIGGVAFFFLFSWVLREIALILIDIPERLRLKNQGDPENARLGKEKLNYYCKNIFPKLSEAQKNKFVNGFSQEQIEIWQNLNNSTE
ncbi:MAG: hypothetical protein ChlgKO_14440 [Chlamydiales bacterium]